MLCHGSATARTSRVLTLGAPLLVLGVLHVWHLRCPLLPTKRPRTLRTLPPSNQELTNLETKNDWLA